MDQIFDNIVKEFLLKEVGKEAWEVGKDQLTPYFNMMARVKWAQLQGAPYDVQAIEALRRGIEDIVAALQSKIVNELKEKLESAIKELLKQFFF